MKLSCPVCGEEKEFVELPFVGVEFVCGCGRQLETAWDYEDEGEGCSGPSFWLVEKKVDPGRPFGSWKRK